MVSTVARAYVGSGGLCPSGVQGLSPWSGERSPPEADDILAFWEYICELILTRFTEFCSICE